MSETEGPEEQKPNTDSNESSEGAARDPSNAAFRNHDGPEVFGQQIKHRQLSARVPNSVTRGIFSTGAIVLTGQNEFVVDFLLRMARPYQIAARVVIPHAAMLQMIKALQDNLRKYEDRFGKVEPMPKSDPNAHQPSVQEIYDDLKIPDETLSGFYANGCIIGHSPAEFIMDFVTNFFPRSAVSARVFMSARQIPPLLKSFIHATDQLRQRRADSPSPDQAPPAPRTPPPGTDSNDNKSTGDNSNSDLLY